MTWEWTSENLQCHTEEEIKQRANEISAALLKSTTDNFPVGYTICCLEPHGQHSSHCLMRREIGGQR